MKNLNFITYIIRNFRSMNSGDLPQLTSFLKSNQGFKQMCWKFFHFKKNIAKKLDDHIMS